MPSSRQVRSTRTAISPRLAMRTLRNMVGRIVPRLRFDDVRWVEETDSTNSRLLDDARAGAPEGRVLVADHQTAGRGRLGRRWEAPAGASLLLSVLLRPDLPPERRHLVTAAVALAEADADAVIVGIGINVNWPDDPPAGGVALNQLAGSTVDRDAVADALLGAL